MSPRCFIFFGRENLLSSLAGSAANSKCPELEEIKLLALQTAQHGASYADYSASASFNSNSGRFDYSGDGSYWERMGRPDDREGRQMHNFFDISTLENNRKEAEEKKKQLKNVDWRKYKEDRKKRKRLMKERWLHED